MSTVLVAIGYGLLIAAVTVPIFYVFAWISLVVHEGGHFLAARCVDAKVDVVRLGSGPLFRSFECSGTRWEMQLIPMHGTVHVEEGIFAYSIRQLSTIVLGGPIASLLLALLLTWIFYGQAWARPGQSTESRDFLNQLSEFSTILWCGFAASPVALVASAWAILLGSLIPARMAIGDENLPTDGLQLWWFWFPKWKRESPNKRSNRPDPRK